MNTTFASKFAAKFTALSLAATITLTLMMGIQTLSQTERADAAFMAQQSQPASAPQV